MNLSRFFVAAVLINVQVASVDKVHAQTEISAVIQSFHEALVQSDSITLAKFLHDDLSYGHSNGWIETKEKLIYNHLNRILVYHEINTSELQVQITGNIAVARCNASCEVALEGKPLTLKLHICQVWLHTKDGWQLLARQSTKIS